METNCVFIKDNTGSQKKLQDIQQRTTSYSKNFKYFREPHKLNG